MAVDPVLLPPEVREAAQASGSATSGRRAWTTRHSGTVVHFCGPPPGSEGLIITDGEGRAQRVPPAALTNLFRRLGASIRCAVFNACLTEEQAEAIATHIPCVVGRDRLVADHAAIAFARTFYRAIAFEQTAKMAFDLGPYPA